MKFTKLRVENYKGLREFEIPLSPCVCLIGENSVGKSSVLQSLSLFFSGSALAKTNYFDDAKSIRIQLSLAEIDDDDINRLAAEHRDKIRAIIKDRMLTLVRVYGPDGKSSLKYRRLTAAEERFSDGSLGELLKNKRPGKAFVDAVVSLFPELDQIVSVAMKQGEMRAAIEQLADGLPNDHKIAVDADLPTGIDKSISAMLPEHIYIPAVKDLKDDVKTTESTPFGKVLRILLEAIEPLLAHERALFDELNSKLNRIVVDGNEQDNRLAPVKRIEEVVLRFVQETFKNVSLRITIPPPELKAVLSSAIIYANDGVDGPIDTKGDGLRRAIVFAIIRSYVELTKIGLIPQEDVLQGSSPRYFLLFEEPELYLHPRAQEILFDALRVFSQLHSVVVTTHSPLFFGPQATTTFIKMRKVSDPKLATKPFGSASFVDLCGANERDQFQIICYENNNIAFFYDTVVLVEGDSDYIVIPHLARIVNPHWDTRQTPTAFTRLGGKGSIRRYKEFFRRFETRVIVVTDLDFLLGDEFHQVNPSRELCTQRDQLLEALDAALEAERLNAPEVAAQRLAAEDRVPRVRDAWRKFGRIESLRRRGEATDEQAEAALRLAEAAEGAWVRADVLKNPPNQDVRTRKRNLIELLRNEGVCVWEKGTIEDYYPAGIAGNGKVARAQALCKLIGSRDDAIALCGRDHTSRNGQATSEFEAVFEHIFS